MKRVFAILPLLLTLSVPALAQSKPPSSWGVSVGFVPEWKSEKNVKTLATLIFQNFDDDGGEFQLSGDEFRIGITRGRRLSGNWSASFVQRRLSSDAVSTRVDGSSCVNGAQNTQNCTEDRTRLTPADAKFIGFEVNKFIAFVTIAQRVQVGMNIAGGFSTAQGSLSTQTFRRSYRCTFTQSSTFVEGNPCGSGTLSNDSTAATGTGTAPATDLLGTEKNRIPTGKLEIAVAGIIVPRVKVMVSGGLNFPGQHVISVTGIYMFGDN